MVDPISVIRQMMAESKFYEAQKTAEMHLYTQSESLRPNLLPLYLELLELQDKRLPEELIIEAAELTVDIDLDESIKWMEKLLKHKESQNYRRIQILKIKVAEKKGRLDELYSLISELNMSLFVSRVPAKIEFVNALIFKYFKNDFHLKLQELALELMLSNLKTAEVQVSDLICACIEKASPKGTKEKLLAVAEIINTQKEKSQLEIYQNYCRLAAEGMKDKSEFKKIAEMVIYFDDFKFQVLILDLFEKLELNDISTDYALEVRANPDYDFVYIEKYFGHLKKFFARHARATVTPKASETDAGDYRLEKPLARLEMEETSPAPFSEEESLIISALKYQSYPSYQLIELATSFLQSSYPRAALFAATEAMKTPSDNKEFLKACYLKATSLFQIADYRAVLDLSLEALNHVEVQDDILSFLYLQADAYFKLGLKKDAKRTLKKILSIDEKYRFTRERLERLDEI